MKRFVLPVLALLFIAAGCNMGTKKKALEFNNTLAAYTQDLSRKGNEVGVAIGTARGTKDFTQVRRLAGELLTFVDDRSNSLAALDNVGGSENLKSAMQSFLAFEKELVQEALIPFTKMDASTPEGEIDQALQNLSSKASEESRFLDKVRTEQEAFAKKNGFKIEPAKTN